MTSAAPIHQSVEPVSGLAPVKALALGPVLDDLGIAPDRARTLGDAPSASSTRCLLVGIAAQAADRTVSVNAIIELAQRAAEDATLLVFAPGEPQDPDLAAVRNALWPAWHVSALYRVSHMGIDRVTLEGRTHLRSASGLHGVVLVARRREFVLAPEQTTAKFDRNAASWNGDPASANYGHFRWMRKFVALYAGGIAARRILDFGSGAGWVGIEAALAAREKAAVDPLLAAFDPSPEMVKLAEENARASGITRVEFRTGFGEDPPLPAAGEERFDLVLSSGVVSFARDRERWLDGIAGTLARGGTLVIGDIHRDSRGMKKRRVERPLLPVRELNATTRDEVRALLERRGLVFERGSGYQLSDPIPQLMHFDQRRTGGMFARALLAWNRRAAASSLRAGGSDQERFDSWVMRMKSA